METRRDFIKGISALTGLAVLPFGVGRKPTSPSTTITLAQPPVPGAQVPHKTAMKVRPKVQTLKLTCEAYPSQWEGQLQDGRFVYIRYRYGVLRMGIGVTEDEAADNTTFGRGFIEKALDADSNMMSTMTMALRLEQHLDFTNTKHGV